MFLIMAEFPKNGACIYFEFLLFFFPFLFGLLRYQIIKHIRVYVADQITAMINSSYCTVGLLEKYIMCLDLIAH